MISPGISIQLTTEIVFVDCSFAEKAECFSVIFDVVVRKMTVEDEFDVASAIAIAATLEVLLVRLGKFFKPCFLLFNVVAFVALFIVLHFF